jgi:hypothetical protein
MLASKISIRDIQNSMDSMNHIFAKSARTNFSFSHRELENSILQKFCNNKLFMSIKVQRKLPLLFQIGLLHIGLLHIGFLHKGPERGKISGF